MGEAEPCPGLRGRKGADYGLGSAAARVGCVEEPRQEPPGSCPPPTLSASRRSQRPLQRRAGFSSYQSDEGGKTSGSYCTNHFFFNGFGAIYTSLCKTLLEVTEDC